ncbi:MAG: glycosyltransferase family 4 protein [Thermoguttaceae bacterium]
MTYRVLVPVTNPLGGIRTYIIYSLAGLCKYGYSFTFLSESTSVFDTFKNDVRGWPETTFLESPPNGGSRGMIQSIRLALKNESFDLIHAQGLRAGTEAAAANFFRTCSSPKTPLLITLHDVIVPMNDIPGRFRTLKKGLISFFTRRASVIVPVSHDCMENHLQIFPAWKKGPVKLQVIFNGIDLSRMENGSDTTKSDIRSQFQIPSDALLGGFFGRFMPQKGFDILLKSLEKLIERGYKNRFHLLVTADQSGYYYETLQDAAKNPDVAQMIHFVDAVPNIVPILKQVDVTVIPSRWEACPLLPMESLVLGVPVIGTDALGLREVLQNTPSRLVSLENPEKLCEALINEIEKPNRELAKQFVSEACKRFDVHNTTEQLLQLYQKQTAKRVIV